MTVNTESHKYQQQRLQAIRSAAAVFAEKGFHGSSTRDIAEHLVLPVSVLTLVNFAGIMLLTRSSMLETMREDFILTARAKGLPEKAVRDRHAARTALLPVTTSLVLAVATVIDGGIITEFVFSWPGMGEVLISSVTSEDIPLAVAAFSFIGVMALIGHFVVDMLYGVLDPRIRVSGSH